MRLLLPVTLPAFLWLLTAAQEPELRTTLKGQIGPVMSLAFSPDGGTLASGSADETIKLWDVQTGKERATFKGHTTFIGSVWSVAFSPDGETLASGSYDTTIKLWDVR